MMRQTGITKTLEISIIALLVIAASVFATITSVEIDGGIPSKDVNKGDTFTIPVVVQSSNESTLTVSGSGSDITCDSSQVQVSGTTATFTGCSASDTGSKVFTATCGSVSDTITYIVTESTQWTVSISESSGTVTVTVTATGGTLSGVMLTLSGVSDTYKTSGPAISNLDLGDISSSSTTSWTFSQGASSASVSVTVTSPAETKSASVSGSSCGNGDLDAGEDCDGSIMPIQNCVDYSSSSYTGGTLSCSASCTFVTSGCTSSGGDTGGDTSTGGSTGGAATLPPVEQTTVEEETSTTFATVLPGEPAKFTVANAVIGISEITLNSNSEASDVQVTVKKHSSRPSTVSSAPTRAVYQYLEINLDNLDNTALNNAEIKFKVSKSWISLNSMDKNTVVLLRYNNGAWQELSTTYLSEDGASVYYSATTPGFSVFAISGVASSAYLKQTSMNPTTKELQDISINALGDSLIQQKLSEYIGARLDVEATKAASVKGLESISLSRTVETFDTYTKMYVHIKNTGSQSISNFFIVEAVPKSIVEDIYELRDFSPRKYDVIIKEDPIISWKLKEVETAIVAWEFSSIAPGEEIIFSYKIDEVFEADNYVAPIFVIAKTTGADLAGEDDGYTTDYPQEEKAKKTTTIVILFLVGLIAVGAVLYLTGKKKAAKTF